MEVAEERAKEDINIWNISMDTAVFSIIKSTASVDSINLNNHQALEIQIGVLNAAMNKQDLLQIGVLSTAGVLRTHTLNLDTVFAKEIVSVLPTR
mmetsp:Transcript_1711/g.2402  ORF Transcript_1711/g.2402 Transcript_1711/m.2402 type:complete len:95 (-) Transcript_1711:8640-8924(-)